MTKPGRIGLLMALLAPLFAAVVALAAHFKSNGFFVLGFVGVVAVFSPHRSPATL